MTEILGVVSGSAEEAGNAKLLAFLQTLSARGGATTNLALFGAKAKAEVDAYRQFVDQVIVIDGAEFEEYHPSHCLDAVADLVSELKPSTVVVGYTHLGMDLAPRIAIRFAGTYVGPSVGIEVDGDRIVFVRPTYRGQLETRVTSEQEPAVVLVQPGGDWKATPQAEGAIVQRSVGVAADGVEVLSTTTEEGDQGISTADVIVSGGRGIGTKENFALIEQLAAALGGVAGCSRPLADTGWVDRARQVGVSGTIVKPKLYIACGISGALEHLVGMKDCEMIVAINSDADAPIFRYAHLGIVGDLTEIIPQLLQDIEKVRN